MPVIQCEDSAPDQRWKLIPAGADYFPVRNGVSSPHQSKTLKGDGGVVVGKLSGGKAVKNQRWRPIPAPGAAG